MRVPLQPWMKMPFIHGLFVCTWEMFQASGERLTGTQLMEWDEIWGTGRKYVDMAEY